MEKTKNLDEDFCDALLDWEEHCKKTSFSSNPNDYIDCQAFLFLVKMGKPILPLIYNAMQVESSIHGLEWASLVHQIVGPQFKLPKKISGKVDVIHQFTKLWLESALKLGPSNS